jgi:hypothetical protein
MLISLLLIVPLVGGWERGHCCPSPNQDTSKVTESAAKINGRNQDREGGPVYRGSGEAALASSCSATSPLTCDDCARM